jgi:hypothetical protein
MDLTLFTILWIAYLQIHEFEPTTEGYNPISGTEWACKYDSTKTIRLFGQSAFFDTINDYWQIVFQEDKIIGLGDHVSEPYSQFLSVKVFSDFGPEFETWMANIFETMNCDPNFNVDFSNRIKQEKVVAAVMLGLSELIDDLKSSQTPDVNSNSETQEELVHRQTKDIGKSNSDDTYIL